MKRKTARAESFTEGRVESFACPASREVTRGPNKGQLVPVDYALYWDERVPGLGVRVMSTGARSYIFEKRVHGASQRTTIGPAGEGGMKLGAARDEARKLMGVADPKAKAAAERAEAAAKRVESQRHTHTVAAVWQAYIAANDDNPADKRWGERHRSDHIALARPGGVKRKRGTGLTKAGPLADLMSRRLSELTPDTVASWMKREAKIRPTRAAGAYRLLRAFCAWTQEKPDQGETDYRGIVAPDACTAATVLKWLPAPKSKDGDKLQRGDLRAWFNAVRALNNPVIAAYLQCLLLTGARREELAGLRWKDVTVKDEAEWSSLVLRDKVEGKRTISLTPYAASLLASLSRPNKWVFASPTAEGGRLVEPTRAHMGALSAAGINHVSLHGLRRTFATLPDYLDDMPAGVIAQIMGHKPSATAEKHYKTRPIDVLHKWHSKIEAWILNEAGVVFTRPGDRAKLGTVNADGTVQTAA